MADATAEDIRFDLDLDLAVKGIEPILCTRCEGWVFGDACPCSPGEPVDPAERGDTVTQEEFDVLWKRAGG